MNKQTSPYPTGADLRRILIGRAMRYCAAQRIGPYACSRRMDRRPQFLMEVMAGANLTFATYDEAMWALEQLERQAREDTENGATEDSTRARGPDKLDRRNSGTVPRGNRTTYGRVGVAQGR